MSQEFIVYVVNLIIGAILAGVMSQYWRLQAGGVSLRFWIIAAWTLTLADLLFVIRSGGVENPIIRTMPTVLVTAGHAMLLLAAQQVRSMRSAAEVSSLPRGKALQLLTGVVALHIVALVVYRTSPSLGGWRSVTNGIIWGALSFSAAWTLWRSGESVRRVMMLPALVLSLQGLFHTGRILLATRALVEPGSNLTGLVQLLGDMEVSLFMVSLFVSVLVALLRQSNAELLAALNSVRQLSSMLPVCAWCNRVRDDNGSWRRLEDYLETRAVSVTHSLCDSCDTKHFAGQPAARPT